MSWPAVERDGEIPALEDKTSSEFLQGFLPKSIVVKAFNHLRADELTEHAQEPSTPNRRALAIATVTRQQVRPSPR